MMYAEDALDVNIFLKLFDKSFKMDEIEKNHRGRRFRSGSYF